MASPVDADRVTSTSGGTTDDEPLTMTLPGSIASGDLLVMLAGINNGGLVVPSGWTRIFAPTVPGGGHDLAWQSILYRVADGSEGATVDIDLTAVGGSVRWATIVYRITGAATSGTIVELSAEVSADSINFSQVTNAPSGGSEDYLFLILGTHIGAIASQPAAAATNYSNFAAIGSGGTGSASSKVNVASCSRQLTASTETSPLWSLASRELNGALLLAVYPAPVVEGPALAGWVRAL